MDHWVMCRHLNSQGYRWQNNRNNHLMIDPKTGYTSQDIGWETQTIQVWGKRAKQRKGRFGHISTRYLREHLAGFSPNGNIWGLSADGIASMLKRLQRKTGIVCNPHSFRRTWTIETIKNGTNLLDVQILGGWESLEMVRRYAREVNSEDAILRYKPVLQ